MVFVVPADASDHPPSKRVRRWPVFLLGLILGAGVAVGVFLALGDRPPWMAGPHGGDAPPKTIEAGDKPTDDEVFDYLDGKTLNLSVKDVNEKPKAVTLRRANLTDLKWTGAGQISGLENPWNHTYMCLYSDETGIYILDLRIPVRVVGSRRVFLPLDSARVTPIDKVFTPTTKK